MVAIYRLSIVLMTLLVTLSACGVGNIPDPALPRADASPLAPTVRDAPWYDRAWVYRKKLTIDSTKVAGTVDLRNFPVFIHRVDPDWRSADHGGQVGKADGADFVFTASDGRTPLDHELEHYDATTGQLVAWVRLPVVSPTADTALYVYYGNAAAANQQQSTAVWDKNYRGVWHLHAAHPAFTGAVDSTANRNHGYRVGTIDHYAGPLDGSFDFTAAGNYLDHGNRASVQLTGAMTLSAWVNPRSYPEVGQIIGKQGGQGNRGWTLRLDSDQGITFNVARDADTSAAAYSSQIPPNTWTFVTAVYDPGTALRIYINGVLDAERTTGVPRAQYNNRLPALMGKRKGCSPCELDGRLDEVRVIAVARPASWILTEYQNQSSPATFYAVSQQEGRDRTLFIHVPIPAGRAPQPL